MSGEDPRRRGNRVRREPPRFRRVEVRGTEERSPRLLRVALAGPELDGFAVDEVAASVRLLLPSLGAGLLLPIWNGNEFLLPDGTRPTIRTLTPRRFDPAGPTLEVDIVRHGTGAASTWAEQAGIGDPVAISGPGRGYPIDAEASAFLLAGDETAIPAIDQLLEALPVDVAVQVHLEVADPTARLPLTEHPRAVVEWHDLAPGAPAGDAIVAALATADLDDGTRVWVAGEAAGVQRVRRLLFEERGLARSRATVRGYWKHGRDAGAGGDG